MGLKADFDEVITAWPKYPLRLKAWLVLSLFLASGSIASLSDTVFRWKGFISDAIVFYQSIVSTPIHNLFKSWLSIELPRGLADSVILLGVTLTANIRVMRHTGESYIERKYPLFTTFFFFLAVIALWLVQSILKVNLFSFPQAILFFLITTIVSTALHLKYSGAAKYLWFAYLLAPFIILSLAAAVNAGLTR
jgi:hypothetical protein